MSEVFELMYWDSNVFLAYINGDPERLTVIDTLLEEVSVETDRRIYTSVLSKVEVAFAASEQSNGILDSDVESAIDALWGDNSVVELIEFHDDIARLAREMMRFSISQGWSLKAMDAIHLATAKWIDVSELFTYDSKLYKYDSYAGYKIVEPYTLQNRLPNI